MKAKLCGRLLVYWGVKEMTAVAGGGKPLICHDGPMCTSFSGWINVAEQEITPDQATAQINKFSIRPFNNRGCRSGKKSNSGEIPEFCYYIYRNKYNPSVAEQSLIDWDKYVRRKPPKHRGTSNLFVGIWAELLRDRCSMCRLIPSLSQIAPCRVR